MFDSLSLSAGRPHGLAVRLFFASALIAVAAAAAVPAHAQGHHGFGGADPMAMGPGPGGPFGGSPRHIERMLDSVSATDAQRTQIKQIVAAASTDLKSLHDSGRALRAKSVAVLTAPTIDENAADQVRMQQLDLHDRISRKMLRVTLDVAQVLTPDQRAKIAAMLAKRGERMHQMNGAAPKS